MIKKLTLLVFLFINFDELHAQQRFSGSFLMSFQSPEKEKDFPLLWNIQSVSGGNKMALEIQDNMIEKGVSKRVIFDPVDSTWTMLIEFNNVRQGTRVHASKMYRDTILPEIVKMKNTDERKLISGFQCKKIILESNKYIADIWVTEKIKFDLGNIYKLLSHCGMMSDAVRKGDWFTSKNIKGMIMEVTSKKKSTGESYTMNISLVKSGQINNSFFNISGFRISDIPEGQNCGVPLDED